MRCSNDVLLLPEHFPSACRLREEGLDPSGCQQKAYEEARERHGDIGTRRLRNINRLAHQLSGTPALFAFFLLFTSVRAMHASDALNDE